jgi:hypothetical protein
MFTVTRGSIYETYESSAAMNWTDAVCQAERWHDYYPDEVIIIYDENVEPVKVWLIGVEL